MFRVLSILLHTFLSTLHFLTRYHLPLLVAVNVIITNEKGQFLVQERADKQGYGFLGGFTRAKESIEDALKREVYEESGIHITNIELFSINNPTPKNPFILSLTYTAHASTKSPRNTWEGDVSWMPYKALKGRMAFDFEAILKKYIKQESP